jgi:glyceraldehyde 3-phosphate dehydrogenase
MEKVRIAINGFGRIGRGAFKIALKNKNIQVVAINDLTDNKTLAHLLKYDSVQGNFSGNIKASEEALTVNGKKIPAFSERDPLSLPWKNLSVDIVLECTGVFRDKARAGLHLKAGAKKVVISAPSKGNGIQTIVPGVNDNKISKNKKIYDLASCTTNCIAPVMKIMCDNFGVKKALMTTIHAYTADQKLIDAPHKDLRRARSAAINIIPTTTGAAIATTKVIPQLKGKFDGMAIRVPVADGSLSDITIRTKKKVTIEQINKVFKKEARLKKWQGILQASEEPLVSTDIIGNSHSSVVDLLSTAVIGDNLVKIISWYDNEWGYSNRLIEFCEKL